MCVPLALLPPLSALELTLCMLRDADSLLDNESAKIDFKPLYTCIHIYDTLDARDELQLSYQADRRVRLSPLHLTLPRLPR